MPNPMTVGQLARHFGVPEWRARRVVDSLEPNLPRVGLYRLVPADMLGKIEQELRTNGWLPTTSAPKDDTAA